MGEETENMEQKTKKWKLQWIYKALLLCFADVLIVMDLTSWRYLCDLTLESI